MGRKESERHRQTLLNGESSPGRQRQRKSEKARPGRVGPGHGLELREAENDGARAESPKARSRRAPRPGETKPAGGSHRDRDRPRPCHRLRAAETETSGGEPARRAQRGQRAHSVEPLAGREALRPRAETPRAPEREAEPEAGGATSGGESKSPEGKRAEPAPGAARRGATAATARPEPTWRLLGAAAAPRVPPARAPHRLAASPPLPAMSRTRAQRRPPAMTAARAGGEEAGARGWRRGAPALPHPASPPPPPPGPL
nr:WAS/WASL-interacting protein family member 2-like [Globicephala melas]